MISYGFGSHERSLMTAPRLSAVVHAGNISRPSPTRT